MIGEARTASNIDNTESRYGRAIFHDDELIRYGIYVSFVRRAKHLVQIYLDLVSPGNLLISHTRQFIHRSIEYALDVCRFFFVVFCKVADGYLYEHRSEHVIKPVEAAARNLS